MAWSIWEPAVPWPIPARRIAADQIRTATENGAVVISALDPVYFDLMVGHGSGRRMIPMSRDVEYASKLISTQRVRFMDPPPRWPTDHRSIGLLKAGAREAVQFTANERLDLVNALVDGLKEANTAEELGRRYGITREQADRFALRSHANAKRARDAGWFDQESGNCNDWPLPLFDALARERGCSAFLP
jgi:hypothetical protein